jgi:DNA-binding MarR family transcriptional regulator
VSGGAGLGHVDAGEAAVGGSEVAVGGSEVAVGGSEVAVGGSEAAVSGREVAVGGSEVAVSGREVAVGGRHARGSTRGDSTIGDSDSGDSGDSDSANGDSGDGDGGDRIGTSRADGGPPPPGSAPAVELADAVWTLLGAIRRLKARRAHDRGGLGTGELRVLGQLGAMGAPTSMGDLGRSAGLNPASTSATVDRLEADGLVARERDTADRRVVRVTLTPEGRETVARRVAAWQAEWAVDLAALPEEDLVVTARTLAAIAATIDPR